MKRSKARGALKAKKAAAKAAGMKSPGGQSRYALRDVQPAKADPNRRSPWWARGDGLKGLYEDPDAVVVEEKKRNNGRKVYSRYNEW